MSEKPANHQQRELPPGNPRSSVSQGLSPRATAPKTASRVRSTALLLAAWIVGSVAAGAQQAASTSAVSALLQPSLGELRSTIAGLRIAKWKAPGPVKDEAYANAGSVDRDLQATLPSLISQADAAPQSVADSFAVYRNLDALYEVLLRISGTAELAASDEESANVAHSLTTLDAARRTLADSILSTSREQQAALSAPKPAVAAAPPAAPVPLTVVSDGPAVTSAHRKPKVRPKVAQPATPQN